MTHNLPNLAWKSRFISGSDTFSSCQIEIIRPEKILNCIPKRRQPPGRSFRSLFRSEHVSWSSSMCSDAKWLEQFYHFRRTLYLYNCAVIFIETLTSSSVEDVANFILQDTGCVRDSHLFKLLLCKYKQIGARKFLLGKFLFIKFLDQKFRYSSSLPS